MRVAHIIVSLGVGGAETALFRLVTATPDGREDCLVVSLTDLGAIGERLLANNVRVVALNLNQVFLLPVVLVRLVLLLKNFRPDVVQTWMYHADLLGGVAARLAGVKVVSWGIRNTLVPRINAMQKLLSASCAWLSRSVPTAIICASAAAIEPYRAAGYDMTKARVIRNGIPVGTPAPVRPRLRADGERFRVGCVGRWHVDKGQDVLLAAAQLLERDDVVFVLIGRGCTEDNPALARWLVQLGDAASRVELLGERGDVPALLAGLDIFCMPSRTEGFPNGLAEAMASGLPCVACDVGDAGYVLGDTGIMVPPENPVLLCQALDRMLDLSEAARAALGASARARIATDFSMATMRAAYDSFYRELIGEAGDVRA